MSTDLIISRVDKARQLLAEAKDAPSAKRVVDMAHAAEVYARRQKLSEETIDHAHAIKIDAMRLLGEHLSRGEKNRGAVGTAGPGRGKTGKRATETEARFSPPTYAEMGLTHKDAAEAQTIAKIARDGDGLYDKLRANETTVAAAKREIAPPPKPTPISNTFYLSLKGLAERIEGIREQYGTVEEMFDSPVWAGNDTQFVIELVRELKRMFWTLDKEMQDYARQKKKLPEGSRKRATANSRR